MIFLRSFIFNILFYSYTALIAAIGIPLLPSRRMTYKIGRLWTRGTMLMLKAICGIDYEIRGKENILNTPAIYASKHQSAWETLIFYLVVPKPVYVLKRELLFLPLVGFYFLRLGSIAVDRKAGASAMRSLLSQAQKVIARGASIIIYPEGTRTAPGAEPKYHPGVAALYSNLGVPVVPVALNSGLFWGRKAFLKKPGTIVLEVLPAIAPGGDRKQFLSLLENTIESASTKLLRG